MSLLSSFSARRRDLSRSRDLLRLSPTGVDDGLRGTEAASWGDAVDVVVDTLCDLPRL